MRCDFCGQKIRIAVGQRFTDCGIEYILAQVGEGMVCLISLVSGNRYAEPIEVGNITDITEMEWDYIKQWDKFVLSPNS